MHAHAFHRAEPIMVHRFGKKPFASDGQIEYWCTPVMIRGIFLRSVHSIGLEPWHYRWQSTPFLVGMPRGDEQRTESIVAVLRLFRYKKGAEQFCAIPTASWMLLSAG